MVFHTRLLFVYAALCVLLLHSANTFKVAKWLKKQPRIVGFSWTDCGSASDPIHVKSLNVGPDPIKLPGNITIDTSFNIATASPTDVALSVVMEAKVAGFFIKVPCVDNVGSCTYGDICKDWAEACPKYFEKYGIPCTCPIPPNTYTISDLGADITTKLPLLAKGTFRITGNLVSASAGHLGCLQIQITVTS